MRNWPKLGQFPSLHLQDPADEERDTGCGPRPVRALLAQGAVEVADFAVDKAAGARGLAGCCPVSHSDHLAVWNKVHAPAAA